jgi:hypothetical protein
MTHLASVHDLGASRRFCGSGTIRCRLDNVCPIGDAVEQRLAQPRIGNDLGPFRERQVSGHDHCRLFGPFRDHLEQELGPNFGQRHVADFIERDKVVAGLARQRAAELQLVLGLDHFVDRPRRGRESHSSLLPAGGHRKRGKQMGLAGAARNSEQTHTAQFSRSVVVHYRESGRRTGRKASGCAHS